MKDMAAEAALTASARLNDAAVQAGFDALHAGITEREVADVIAAQCEAQDAKTAFAIVRLGANGAFPTTIPAIQSSRRTWWF